MSTMKVFFDLSRCFNFLVWVCVVLLVSVCVSSTIPSVGRGVRFPEDIIVFPSEYPIEIKEKRSGDFGNREELRHGPEFHKFQPPKEFSPNRVGHSQRPPFQHSAEFHRTHNFGKIPNHVLEYNNRTSNMIPLDLIQDINKLNNVSEVLYNFVEGDETMDADSPFLTDRFGSGERNAAITPKSAGCMPELQTVKLASSEDVSVLYIPQCTRIERCGGCCSHHLLSCQPTQVQPVTFSVMKTQYVGGQKLKFVGKEIIVMEKHIKCKCDCKVKAEDCNRFQQYRKSECKCACVNNDEEKKCYRKNQTKLWDPELCSCICREQKQCSTGFEFDPVECKCAAIPTRNRYSEAIPRIDYEEK